MAQQVMALTEWANEMAQRVMALTEWANEMARQVMALTENLNSIPGTSRIEGENKLLPIVL